MTPDAGRHCADHGSLAGDVRVLTERIGNLIDRMGEHVDQTNDRSKADDARVDKLVEAVDELRQQLVEQQIADAKERERNSGFRKMVPYLIAAGAGAAGGGGVLSLLGG